MPDLTTCYRRFSHLIAFFDAEFHIYFNACLKLYIFKLSQIIFCHIYEIAYFTGRRNECRDEK